MFGNRRHVRELLTRSEERIAPNILADRLKLTSALLASLALTGSQRRSAAPSRLSIHLRGLRVKPWGECQGVNAAGPRGAHDQWRRQAGTNKPSNSSVQTAEHAIAVELLHVRSFLARLTLLDCAFAADLLYVINIECRG
jgi:hypothetical protein